MILSTLLEITSVKELSQDDQLKVIGSIFDHAFDEHSLEGITHSFSLAKDILYDKLNDTNKAVYNYYIANGWSYLRKLKYTNTSSDWNFQMEELNNEIFHLRKAIAGEGFNLLHIQRKCQIYTNLGNCYNYIGRFVESLFYWNEAITLISTFGMALGNRANGIFHYGVALFDEVHKDIFTFTAYQELRSLLIGKQSLDPFAAEGLNKLFQFIDNRIPQENKTARLTLNDYNLGNDKDLRPYREWSLKNQLYLNPLNDLGPFTIASHDCLNMPTLVLSSKRPPVILNLFNQIKQEYATARFSLFQAGKNNETHFSDIDVDLVETQETIRYSYYVEQLKIAFRLAYSILDKLAFLLNDYFMLGVALSNVSFKVIWYKDKKKKVLYDKFAKSNNWPLRGLFWLSKDLFEKENDFDSVLSPVAKDIADIRNYIEHRGFKIVSDLDFFEVFDKAADPSLTIKRKDFADKTLNLLKLTRAAIIYTALAIFDEESKKDYSDIKSFPVTPGIIPDYMKI